MSFLRWEVPFLTPWPHADRKVKLRAEFSQFEELLYDCCRYILEDCTAESPVG